MSDGYPRFTQAARQGEYGVNIVSRVINETFCWLFKRNHQEHDFGIDGQIEVINRSGFVTGQMIAVQIKYGKSFFQEKNKWGYVYRGESKHFNYLSNYPIAVLIVICHPATDECYWVRFDPMQTQLTNSAWKITIPFGNKLHNSKKSIEAMLPPLRDGLSELQEYWETNKIILSSSYVHFVIDQVEVRDLDTAHPRAFFDHLRSTKELAYHCQGKVEISFHGYEQDRRELFEIEEVRKYVAALDRALPEILFFVRTEEPTYTLSTFILCQTQVRWLDGRSTFDTTRKVVLETDVISSFLTRHYPSLNEMTEWLSLSLEENKKISVAVFQCLKLEFAGDAKGS